MNKYSFSAELKTAVTNHNFRITSFETNCKFSKLKALVFLVSMSLFGYTNALAQAQYSGGDGTPGDPWRISNMQDWEEFAQNGPAQSTVIGFNHFRLTADIGCEDDPVTQMVVGGFAGTFDGNGRTVWVRIESVGVSVGLFSQIGENTTIRDLSVRGLINNKNYFQEYADTEK